VRRATLGRLVAGGALVIASGGCSAAARWRQPASERAWGEARELAQRHVTDGRWTAADSVLVGFVREHAESPEASEARYWRAFYLLDPANPKASPRAAAELLEQYLAEHASPPHATEAATLRRTALTLDSLGTMVATADSARAGVSAREKAALDEAQKLKDELARTQAELERIKKRLASP
jgi:hypothetical protein